MLPEILFLLVTLLGNTGSILPMVPEQTKVADYLIVMADLVAVVSKANTMEQPELYNIFLMVAVQLLTLQHRVTIMEVLLPLIRQTHQIYQLGTMVLN